MHETLQRLFRYKAWANDALLSRLDALGRESAVTGLAVKALSHSHIVDRIFAAHLRRQPHGYAAANASEMPAFGDLCAAMRASDREYVGYVATLRRAQLDARIDFTFTDGKPGCMSREEMLLHVITHGIGHRGQVSAIMLFDSVPPAKDGFTTYLHEAEAAARGRVPTPA